MAEIHILNVGEGDCTIIRHNSRRVTMVDICGGNAAEETDPLKATAALWGGHRGNFAMCQRPTNPILFLRDVLKVDSIFRFILTHPDMDHLDGFDALLSAFRVWNFWDSGVRRKPPDFSRGGYSKADWDRYDSVIAGKENVKVVSPRPRSRGLYWTKDDDGGCGDAVWVYAPTADAVKRCNDPSEPTDVNDASYVIMYNTVGGRVLLPGDAHDDTWASVCLLAGDELSRCEFMLAPHHGRDSSRKWDFLDHIKPAFGLLGCADSDALAYDAWNRRGLLKCTQNQTGNVALYPEQGGLCVYVENGEFAKSEHKRNTQRDAYGNSFLYRIPTQTS